KHDSVRVATAVFGRLDLEVAAEELTGFAAQAVSDPHREVALDSGMAEAAAGHGGGFDAIEFVAQFLPFLPFKEFGERHRLPHGEVHGNDCSTFPHLLQPGDAEGPSAMRVITRGLGGGRSLPGRNLSERNIRVVDGLPAALLRFRAVVLAVVRALAQALDPLAGERDAIERFAILLPLRLAHRAGGEDEIALDDVALDVAAGALAEDSDFVPAGALDPFAAVVATAEARSDADAQRGADLLDFANAADDREFRDRVHGYPFLLSVSPRASAHAVGPSGCGSQEAGRGRPAPARN